MFLKSFFNNYYFKFIQVSLGKSKKTQQFLAPDNTILFTAWLMEFLFSYFLESEHHMMCIFHLFTQHPVPGILRLISESQGWIPPHRFLWWWGWRCVKVNVKSAFVSSQQPGMGETTEDRSEFSPVTGHAAESSALQPHSPFWLAGTILHDHPVLIKPFLIFITLNKTQRTRQVVGIHSRCRLVCI